MKRFALLLLLAVIAPLSTGCMHRQDLHLKVEQALCFEDKVHSQVSTLQAVFDAALPLLPAEKQAEAREKMAKGKVVLQKGLDAKDELLDAALAASAETVDVSVVVPPIIRAVEDIIAIVAEVGADAAFIQTQRAKAKSLGLGVAR